MSVSLTVSALLILNISMTQFQVEHCNEAESLVAGIEACAGKGKTV